jgi:hypothetical protein
VRSPGVVLPGYLPFRAVIQPLAVEVAPCFWLIDDQSGPFDSRWVYASPANEALRERKWFDAPECRNTSASCWRPHTFPRLAEHIVVDEWTYFFAMRCREDEVPQRAAWIVRHIGKLTGEFFEHLSRAADLFLFHADGWWELYTHHVGWSRKFRPVFPASYERSWQKAGQPPVWEPAGGRLTRQCPGPG